MIVNVLTFGVAREVTCSASLQVDIDDNATAGSLLEALRTLYPALHNLRSLAVAVNNEYASAGQVIVAGDEVAIIPPVSGG